MAENQKQDDAPEPTDLPDRTPAEVAKAQEKAERRDQRRVSADAGDEGIPLERLLARPDAYTGFSHAAVSGGLTLAGKANRKNVTIEEAREAAEQFRSHEVQYEN